MNKFTKAMLACAVCASVVLSAQSVRADEMLVNRGLPTTNLNLAAGSSQSNVDWTWGDKGTTSDGGYTLVGDSFTNTSLSTWNISTIQMWSDTNGTLSDLALWGGIDGSPSNITSISTTAVVTPTTYPGTNYGYQAGSNGLFYTLQQIDFAVDVSLAPGQTYDFFLNGSDSDDPAYDYMPFAEASNASLSGSPQDGSNGLYLAAYLSNDNVITSVWEENSATDGSWNKSSDIDVQVFGSSVPDAGSSVLLLGLAMIGLVGFRAALKKVAAQA